MVSDDHHVAVIGCVQTRVLELLIKHHTHTVPIYQRWLIRPQRYVNDAKLSSLGLGLLGLSSHDTSSLSYRVAM
jgi:hypothetical protein